MIRHDLECNGCHKLFCDMPASTDQTRCGHCGGTLEIAWQHSGPPENARALSPSETTVVYRHPRTGKVIYPGRNDRPMPSRYQKAGYERLELASLQAVDRFSKAHHVVNERAHYDRGSGRGYDDRK